MLSFLPIELIGPLWDGIVWRLHELQSASTRKRQRAVNSELRPPSDEELQALLVVILAAAFYRWTTREDVQLHLRRLVGKRLCFSRYKVLRAYLHRMGIFYVLSANVTWAPNLWKTMELGLPRGHYRVYDNGSEMIYCLRGERDGVFRNFTNAYRCVNVEREPPPSRFSDEFIRRLAGAQLVDLNGARIVERTGLVRHRSRDHSAHHRAGHEPRRGLRGTYSIST